MDTEKEARANIIKDLKDSIQYTSQHQRKIEDFKYEIIKYFSKKYNIKVRVLTFGSTFGIEKDYGFYSKKSFKENIYFKMNSKMLFDFCTEFECEFVSTCCDGDRYIFTFDDIDMSRAFF